MVDQLERSRLSALISTIGVPDSKAVKYLDYMLEELDSPKGDLKTVMDKAGLSPEVLSEQAIEKSLLQLKKTAYSMEYSLVDLFGSTDASAAAIVISSIRTPEEVTND